MLILAGFQWVAVIAKRIIILFAASAYFMLVFFERTIERSIRRLLADLRQICHKWVGLSLCRPWGYSLKATVDLG